MSVSLLFANLANYCAAAGAKEAKSVEPMKQQRFVSGLRRKGFKVPLRNITAAES